jgi:hypothetical protein
MTRARLFTLAALLTFAGAVSAETVLMKFNPDKAQFEATRTRLIEQLEGDRYREITPENKTAVIAALDRIEARLSKPGTISEQDRVDIFNDQELINAITSHAAVESRLFCEREAPTGTHRIHVVCLTMAKWMERERTGQTAFYGVVSNHNEKCPGCDY